MRRKRLESLLLSVRSLQESCSCCKAAQVEIRRHTWRRLAANQVLAAIGSIPFTFVSYTVVCTGDNIAKSDLYRFH
jgi:hypothetical protein